jgi:hypothetical protein
MVPHLTFPHVGEGSRQCEIGVGDTSHRKKRQGEGETISTVPMAVSERLPYVWR